MLMDSTEVRDGLRKRKHEGKKKPQLRGSAGVCNYSCTADNAIRPVC